jgi:hypothetical protein
MKRREMIIGLGMAPLATIVPRIANSTQEDKKHEIEYLFVQSAQSATLENGVLTLKSVAHSTIYFSDRPERISGHTPTETFVSQWGVGEDNFKSNPPNAALSLFNDKVPEEIVLTLKNPRIKNGDLIYDVEVIEGNLIASGNASSLFIDVIGRPLTPVSLAGRRRRVRRRVIRR